MRDTLMTPRTYRWLIGSLMVNFKVWDAAFNTNIQALIVAGNLNPFPADFGYFNRNRYTNQANMANGSFDLYSAYPCFAADDENTHIHVQGARADHGTLHAGIVTYVSPTHVVLDTAAGRDLVETSTSEDGLAVWGFNPVSVRQGNPLIEVGGNVDDTIVVNNVDLADNLYLLQYEINLINNKIAAYPLYTTPVYAATVTIDMSASREQVVHITLTGVLTLALANMAAGFHITFILVGDSVDRALTLPAWVAIGAALPTIVPANKTMVLSLTATGTTAGSCICSNGIQP